MERSRMMRLTYGLLFGVPFGLVASAWVQVSPPVEAHADPAPECENCHTAVYQAWEGSQHGQAVTDPRFVDAWKNQGEPVECLQCHTTGFDSATGSWEADGITCAACHSPVGENHPQQTMPTDRSSELCASCHTETAFEWQIGSHAKGDMTCVTCHGQHSTNLKLGNAAALCTSCHLDVAENFVHNTHLEEGLSCASCHLSQVSEGVEGGKSSRNHSFAVVLTTCEQCHAYQVHPDEVIQLAPPDLHPVVQPLEVEAAGLNADPGNVNPVAFALLAGLVGMAAGMILAPWIERWYRRLGN